MTDKRERWEDEPSQEGSGFLQDLFGVPNSPFLTKGDLKLKLLNDIRERGGQRDGSSLEYSSNAPGYQILQPDVNIDFSGMSEQLSPYFDSTIQAQQELARSVEDLGVRGQYLLEENQVQTAHLSSLDRFTQAAHEQRNRALSQLAQLSEQLGFVSQGVQRGVEQRNDANRMSYVALQQRQAGLEQMGQMNRGIESVGMTVAHVGHNISRLLGNLGTDIQGISTEMVKTRLGILEALKHFENVFLWSHRERFLVQTQILDVLSNPLRTQAFEAWRIGEQCRAVGDLKKAKEMFKRSLDVNPAEVKSYISLGMVHFSMGNMEKAKKRLEDGVRYANNQPSLQSMALLCLAKMKTMDNDTSKAQILLEQARNVDKNNLAIWYELAITAAKGGNGEDAEYYIDNILRVPVQHMRGYVIKMLTDPVLAPFLPSHTIIRSRLT